jgi:8-oxo-dGTP diphosphatase
MPPGQVPRSVDAIDWETWAPTDRATLLFVIRDGEILLIHKKRGLGAGKINGPGGRIDPGESPPECAIREVREELEVTPTGLRECGEHRFQFVDGYSIHVHVFTATGCDGVPRETDEAVPLWAPLDRVPYDEMWEDDRIWLPVLLGGKSFTGWWIFDGETMVDHHLEVTTDAGLPQG